MSQIGSPRSVIHIGPHRTGTTSFQRMLGDASARLLTRGIWYPLAGRINHQNLADELNATIGRLDHCTLSWERVLAGTAHCKTLILSAESFSFLLREEIGRIRDMLPEARVLIVLRNPVDWHRSCYGWRLTVGETLEWREFLERELERRTWRLFPRAVENWTQVFSDHIVVAYERHRSNLLEGLLRAAGLEEALPCVDTSIRHGVSEIRCEMDESTRRRILSVYRDEIERLSSRFPLPEEYFA